VGIDGNKSLADCSTRVGCFLGGEQLEIQMSDISETTPRLGTASGVIFAESSTAPYIYFDGVSCHGAMHGVIELELAARMMAPTIDGGVHMTFGTVARLRCSPAAAAALLDSIEKATKMATQPQQQPTAAATKLN
jgi:hypothetical protein